MIAPLTFGNGRSIALAVTLAILMSIAPHEASAKGGMKNGPIQIFSRAEAATITSKPSEP